MLVVEYWFGCVQTHRISDDQTISRDWLRARKATLKNLPKILSCLALVWDEVVAKTSSSSVRFKVSCQPYFRTN